MNIEAAIIQLRDLAEKQVDTQNDLVIAVHEITKTLGTLADTMLMLTKNFHPTPKGESHE